MQVPVSTDEDTEQGRRSQSARVVDFDAQLCRFKRMGKLDPLDGLMIVNTLVNDVAAGIRDPEGTHAKRNDVFRVSPLAGFHRVIEIRIEV